MNNTIYSFLQISSHTHTQKKSLVTQVYNLEIIESTTVEFPAQCSLCNSVRKYHYLCCSYFFADNNSSPLTEPTADVRRQRETSAW